MIIKEGTELGLLTQIKDFEGNIIGKIAWFDTKTKLAKIYASYPVSKKDGVVTNKIAVVGSENVLNKPKGSTYGEVVTFFCTLETCKAYNKKTGEEIK